MARSPRLLASLHPLGLLILVAVLVWSTVEIAYTVTARVVRQGQLQSLCEEAQTLARLGVLPPTVTSGSLPGGRRLTMIAPDGTVLGDSAAPVAALDNHNTRPEVLQARSDPSGLGSCIRHSDTLSRDLLYAAVLLPDRRVLRLSMVAGGDATLVDRLVRPLAILAAAILGIAAVLIAVHLRRGRTRVAELVAVSRDFSNGAFSRRAALLGSDALAHLGHELNAMGARLQASQAEITRQRQLLDAALGVLSEGVACINDLDRVLYANPAYRHLAAGGSEVVGQLYYEHLPVLDAGQPAASAARALGEPPAPQDVRIEHRRRHLRALLVPGGSGVRVLILHDLTELQRLEGARRDFIASISHELKTPLTAIAGFTETLLDGVIEEQPEQVRTFVERISRHAGRLADLVRDVLTLSRMEQGAWEVRSAETDLVRLGRSIIDEFQPMAERHQVAVLLEAPASLTATIDPELVRQLISNLVSNAIRYNRPQGSVRLMIGAGREASTVQVAVIDTGIGIPAAHQERVFERFYRVDAHRSRQSGGTGLGLAIVRQLLELLGGTLAMHSSPEGTTFTIVLPRVDARTSLAATARRAPPPVSAAG